eukprot:TRINITY_DN1118_c0_g1_i13.p1 TRINITY_DN1118_c0_g1~~TRINITY_DN1118_c0_g1_i13.p1  ORF type:complete len:142 (-),score=1.35 TRINITY_DN1118_c0_g1_i13:459-839(-)
MCIRDSSELGHLPLLKWLSPLVQMPSAQPEVHDVHLVLPLAPAYDKVGRLDVSVDVASAVDLFDGVQHLQLRGGGKSTSRSIAKLWANLPPLLLFKIAKFFPTHCFKNLPSICIAMKLNWRFSTNS